ncbi:DUF1007 family protein [Lichenibacterium minor]|uniref:DUF1007 family protein n=1 Tax=Lichenibacterium minor TaxID=2316528 RepID=UPI0024797909|nr:DUF1007 family protein [Lichenibacterium minor]
MDLRRHVFGLHHPGPGDAGAGRHARGTGAPREDQRDLPGRVRLLHHREGGRQGQASEFGEPTDAWSEESLDRRVTLHFTLPLKAPASAARALTLSVYDPTYFVAFTLAEHDPVALRGAPNGCSSSVYKPKALDPNETRALNESFFSNLSPGADFGAKLAEKAVVACP